MRIAVVPAAGRASRLGSRAPRGCKLFAQIPDGRLMVEYLHDLLKPQVDELRFVVRSTVAADERLARFTIRSVDTLAGPLDAVVRAGGTEADDLLIWYSDTLATVVPEGTDWVGIGMARSHRIWDVPHGAHIERETTGIGTTVCAGAYRFSMPARLAEHETMTEAINHYPNVELVQLPGWRDLDDLPLPVST